MPAGVEAFVQLVPRDCTGHHQFRWTLRQPAPNRLCRLWQSVHYARIYEAARQLCHGEYVTASRRCRTGKDGSIRRTSLGGCEGSGQEGTQTGQRTRSEFEREQRFWRLGVKGVQRRGEGLGCRSKEDQRRWHPITRGRWLQTKRSCHPEDHGSTCELKPMDGWYVLLWSPRYPFFTSCSLIPPMSKGFCDF